MSLTPLDNLVRSGQLKIEPAAQAEFDGLLRSGQNRLKDAGNDANSIESRFDVDEALLAALIRVATEVAKRVKALGSLPKNK